VRVEKIENSKSKDLYIFSGQKHTVFIIKNLTFKPYKGYENDKRDSIFYLFVPNTTTPFAGVLP